jgi:hypothetical protein
MANMQKSANNLTPPTKRSPFLLVCLIIRFTPTQNLKATPLSYHKKLELAPAKYNSQIHRDRRSLFPIWRCALLRLGREFSAIPRRRGRITTLILHVGLGFIMALAELQTIASLPCKEFWEIIVRKKAISICVFVIASVLAAAVSSTVIRRACVHAALPTSDGLPEQLFLGNDSAARSRALRK